VALGLAGDSGFKLESSDAEAILAQKRAATDELLKLDELFTWKPPTAS
jgi:hypothetical protein